MQNLTCVVVKKSKNNVINMALIDCFSNMSSRYLVYFYDFSLLKQDLSNYLFMLNSDLPSVKKMFMFILHSYPKVYKNKK